MPEFRTSFFIMISHFSIIVIYDVVFAYNDIPSCYFNKAEKY